MGTRVPDNDADGPGTYPWTNASNATASDNSYAVSASSIPSSDFMDWLKASNFGFSIPSHATLDGIEVTVELKAAASGDTVDFNCVLVIGNATTGAFRNHLNQSPPTSDTTFTFGGASDKWGASPSIANINSSTFGVMFRARTPAAGGDPTLNNAIQVDHITMKIYYRA
jgi:large repetitive protein